MAMGVWINGIETEMEIRMKISFTTCTRCGRKLTALASMARGFGRHCAGIVAKAKKLRLMYAAYSPDQVVKATLLLASGKMAHCGEGVWRVPASNGHDHYLTGTGTCQCPAGRRGRACYHRLAVGVRELVG